MLKAPQFSYGDKVFAVVRKRGGSRWSVRSFVIDNIEESSYIVGDSDDPILYNGDEGDSVFGEEWEAQQECYKRNPVTTAFIEVDVVPMCCSDCHMLDGTMLCKAAGRFAESKAEKTRASFCPMSTDYKKIAGKIEELLKNK